MELNDRFALETMRDKRLENSGNIKFFEKCLQEDIEKSLSEAEKIVGKFWWQHTSVDIFVKLLETSSIEQTIESIYCDLK